MLSYPLFTQNHGGLQVQVLETVAALNRQGVDARLIDPFREKLADFDLIHVFGAGNGNHRMVQHARLIQRPVLLSPLIRNHWTRSLARRAELIDRFMGKLTRYEVTTEYRQLHTALTQADLLLALGGQEKDTIREAFGVDPRRIEVVPNGIPARFFSATPEAFVRHFGIEPGFVLNVASVDAHKNQLGMARALANSGLRMVFIGPCQPANKPYLEQLLALPNTTYLGLLPYDSPLLASAYAAAGVFCLPSHSEVMPLSMMEALASGTPAVVTCHHGMDTAGLDDVLIQVDPLSPQAIEQAVMHLHQRPPSVARCKDAMRELTWDAVATRIRHLYAGVLAGRTESATT